MLDSHQYLDKLILINNVGDNVVFFWFEKYLIFDNFANKATAQVIFAENSQIKINKKQKHEFINYT